MTTRHYITPEEKASLTSLVEILGGPTKLASLLDVDRITLWRFRAGRYPIPIEVSDRINTLAVLYGLEKIFPIDSTAEKKEWVKEQLSIASRVLEENQFKAKHAPSLAFLEELRAKITTKRNDTKLNQTRKNRT